MIVSSKWGVKPSRRRIGTIVILVSIILYLPAALWLKVWEWVGVLRVEGE